jgi:hypothetical protein
MNVYLITLSGSLGIRDCITIYLSHVLLYTLNAKIICENPKCPINIAKSGIRKMRNTKKGVV